MRGSLKSWSGLALLTALGACSNIIGISEIEIDPSLDAPGDGGAGGKGSGGKSSGGKSSGGSTVIPQGGDENGGTAGAADGGTSSGGTPAGGKSGGGTSSGGSAGTSGDAGAGGEPSNCPTDCDDEIACTIDECLPSGECTHTADDTACTGAAGKCTSCQVGIGCVDTEPTVKDLELLLDRNFDEQTGDWEDFSDADVIVTDAAAQSGTHSAYFSPAPAAADDTYFFDLVQTVHIPAGTVKLTASGWYKMIWAVTEDPLRPRTDEYVTLTLFSLADDNGDYTRFHDFQQWDANKGPAVTAWKSFTYDAPKSVLTQVNDLDVTLDLVAETWDTKYHVDSLSLKASVCE